MISSAEDKFCGKAMMELDRRTHRTGELDDDAQLRDTQNIMQRKTVSLYPRAWLLLSVRLRTF